MSATILCLAFLLDYWLGEPRSYHPLVGLGRYIKGIERGFYREDRPSMSLLVRGVFGVVVVLTPFVAFSLLLESYLTGIAGLAIQVIIVYFCIAPKSLYEHGMRVYDALLNEKIEDARDACGMMVSRDTQTLDDSELAKATIESVLENANDAVIAPVVWFLIGGLPGIILFRVVNTLDAMWGYRNARFLYFGRFAARFDDVLGYLPARVSVLLFTMINRASWHSYRRDGSRWYSPNAGPVMAAGAGGLGLQLGGAASYHGAVKDRPNLGEGRAPSGEDIVRSLKFVQGAYVLLFAVLGLALAGPALVCLASFSFAH